MSQELEAAAADAAGGFFSRKPLHGLPVGTPCPNCETPLEGPWCHQCGQKGEDYHRSIGHLITEAFEGLTHFDGRFWRTMPDLVRRPGRLTRAYLDGRRAPQIPPFRLFLVVVLLVFFTGGLGGSNTNFVVTGGGREQVISAPGVKISVEERAAGASSRAQTGQSGFDHWMEVRARAAMRNPEAFGHSLHAWGHRLAVLALPIAAGLLGLLFLTRRRFFLFDHLIFSMHSLSFQGLLLSLVFLANLIPGKPGDLLLFAMPVHLFVHMRGTYGTGVFGTLWRMALLLVGSLIGAGVIMVILMLLGLNELGGH
ncbi:MAG: DUF3667 domain-containing protein [Caulobacterales bacterium]|nr:DUF3667 domain-containing protein [Caulobacterales bacterium]